LVLGGTQLAAGGVSSVLTHLFPDSSLTDLQPDSPNPFDSAKATLRIMETPTATGFKLEVEGIDPSVKGTEFGAHLHVGECKVLDDGSNLTRTHYNTDGQPASRQNEVWFDVVPNANGEATYDVWVSFAPSELSDAVDPGVMSVVIHEKEAEYSSPKQACLPLDVPYWAVS
jgi:hypothetical protein